MATALDLFPARVAFVDPQTGRLTADAVRALNALWYRVGGANAPTNNELVASDDDDSGLEEFKAETAKALDGLALSPVAQAEVIEVLLTEIAGLREQVAELKKQVQGIEEGVEYGRYS